MLNDKIPRLYPYFDEAARLEWSNYTESYAGDRVVTDKAFHAREVKGDDPDKKGVRRGGETPPYERYVLLRSF
jgi:hypothetical protein